MRKNKKYNKPEPPEFETYTGNIKQNNTHLIRHHMYWHSLSFDNFYLKVTKIDRNALSYNQKYK